MSANNFCKELARVIARAAIYEAARQQLIDEGKQQLRVDIEGDRLEAMALVADDILEDLAQLQLPGFER